MSKLIKSTMAAMVSCGLILSTAAVMPATASAHTTYRQTYQCEVTKSNSAKTGAILGVVAGGLIGSQVAKNQKGLGTVAGAVIGGLLGNKIGKDSGKDTCKTAQARADQQRYDDYRGAHVYRSERVSYSDHTSYSRNDNHYGYRR